MRNTGLRRARQRALADLLGLSGRATSRRGFASWTRNDLHARDVPDGTGAGREA